MANPKLRIDGQTIRVPVSKLSAERIISCARQAPFGKGEETVVDPAVRKVWELLPCQFELNNPQWDLVIEDIVTSIQKPLRLSNYDLDATLYRLLVYEPGSFFLSHRDGEKLDGMVATLVVTLPGRHTGGELVVKHDDKTVVLDTYAASRGTALSYTAFYADCEHEVKPLTRGHRVSLVYNITAKLDETQAIASSTAGTSVGLAIVFRQWPKGVKRLAIVLDHRYTASGVRLQLLKGSDLAKAQQVFEAARLANCKCYLTLLTRKEHGASDYYPSTREKFYSREVDWDESGRSKRNLKPLSILELYEWESVADGWTDADGQRMELEKQSLKDEELVYTSTWDSVNPSREEAHGYLGNEGIEVDRWYHRAAMVVLPPD